MADLHIPSFVLSAPLEKAVEESRKALAEHDVAVAGDEWGFAPISLAVAAALRSLLAAHGADKRLEEAERLLREVSASGVEFEDERISYTSVQIDRETWAEVRDYFARREGEKGEANG